ncbi:MAG: glycosyltransferase family 2 protein [Deltaproteobacteria bacterium]|nr:glycosyltransferase family 2 protein [Deltaproteobacteria bacterium]
MAYRVCAIILDYFGAAKTEACLKSLIGQGLATVYLVDNSGSEHASEELRKVVESLRTLVDFKIATLGTGINLGFAKGVNFALRFDCRGTSPHDYFLLLNNDAVAAPSLVHGLISAIDRDPRIALVSPRIKGSNQGRDYGIWYHRYLGLLLSHPRRCCFHYFTGCCLLFGKELLNGGALFDEAFFMYGEDAELGWRLVRQGRKVICAEEVFVEHEYGPSLDRSSFFYEHHMVRAHLLLTLKTYKHVAEIPLLVFCKVIALACRAVVRSIRYFSIAPLAAFCSAWVPFRVTAP